MTSEAGFLSCLVDAAAQLEPIGEETNNMAKNSAKDKVPLNSLHQSTGSKRAVVTDDDNSRTTHDINVESTSRTIRKKKSPSLPIVLMDLLSDPINSDIMTFLPDGDSFAFIDVRRFEATLMKEHFRISRFDTFERKLELWGFRRDNYVAATAGKDGSRTFRHPRFRRGEVDACRKIRCQRRSQCFVYTAVPARPMPTPSMPVSVNDRSSSPASTVSSLGSRPSSPVRRGSSGSLKDIPLEIAVPLGSLPKCRSSDYFMGKLSDSAVNAATREVVGAALGVLMHDKMGMQTQNMQSATSQMMTNRRMHSPMTSMHLQARWMAQQQRRQAMMAMFYNR